MPTPGDIITLGGQRFLLTDITIMQNSGIQELTLTCRSVATEHRVELRDADGSVAGVAVFSEEGGPVTAGLERVAERYLPRSGEDGAEQATPPEPEEPPAPRKRRRRLE